MIEFSKHNEFSKIIETANNFLYEHGYLDSLIIGFNWDGDNSQWVVTYRTNYGNSEVINVWVQTDLKYAISAYSIELEPINVEVNYTGFHFHEGHKNKYTEINTSLP